MPEIPSMVCVNCLIPMGAAKNGVVLNATTKGAPYYKVYADKWRCARCKNEVYVGFGKNPIAMKHDADYERIESDETFELSDNTWYDA